MWHASLDLLFLFLGYFAGVFTMALMSMQRESGRGAPPGSLAPQRVSHRSAMPPPHRL